MSRDKRVRRHSRQNNARSSETNNKDEGSEYSSDESLDNEKSARIPEIKAEKTGSSSSVKSSRRKSEEFEISDESESEGAGDTYTKYESGGSDGKNVEIIDTVRKVEDFLTDTKNSDNCEADSPGHSNEPAKRGKRRKSRKKRRKKNRSLDSNRTADEHEAYGEDGRSSERELSSRSRRKKSRANIPRKSRRRRHTSKGDAPQVIESQDKELPITEILRKAQENPKTRHEEPLPLTELTTDRIYVQGRNGFSAIKIPADRNHGIFGRRASRNPRPPIYPIKVAIVVQKIWNVMGFIHQGLLAGVALMHFLLMQTYFGRSLDFLENYSLASEYYTNIFSWLSTMCVIAAFDKFDLAQLDTEHFREIYIEHSKSVLAIPLYIATFCLHQTNVLIDDNISLMNYPRNTTEIENNSSSIIFEENVTTWYRVTLAKDGLAIFAWLFIALGPREDMFLSHLKAMEKYVETPENLA